MEAGTGQLGKDRGSPYTGGRHGALYLRPCGKHHQHHGRKRGTITYSYNSMGKVYQVTDQEGCSEYFYYDAEGRLETCTDRNGNREKTHYNMDGNLTYRRAEDPKGRTPAVSRYRTFIF